MRGSRGLNACSALRLVRAALRHALPVVGSLALLAASCGPVQPLPAISATSTPVPGLLATETPTPTIASTLARAATDMPTPTPTATIEPSPTGTPTLTPSPTPACETHMASMVVVPSAQTLKVSDALTVAVRLSNEGCVQLGLPQYRLYIRTGDVGAILAPDRPEPVVHYLAVAPGKSDSVEFDLTAVASGQAALNATASFEVHLGYPGPAYWGMASSQVITITVAP